MGEGKKSGIDRGALVRAVQNCAMTPRANSAWCVACGASKGAAPELPRIIDQQITQNPGIIKELTSPEFVKELAERLSTPQQNADWCVACGAESGATPQQLVSDPVQLTDEQIDQLAAVLKLK